MRGPRALHGFLKDCFGFGRVKVKDSRSKTNHRVLEKHCAPLPRSILLTQRLDSDRFSQMQPVVKYAAAS